MGTLALIALLAGAQPDGIVPDTKDFPYETSASVTGMAEAAIVLRNRTEETMPARDVWVRLHVLPTWIWYPDGVRVGRDEWHKRYAIPELPPRTGFEIGFPPPLHAQVAYLTTESEGAVQARSVALPRMDGSFGGSGVGPPKPVITREEGQLRVQIGYWDLTWSEDTGNLLSLKRYGQDARIRQLDRLAELKELEVEHEGGFGSMVIVRADYADGTDIEWRMHNFPEMPLGVRWTRTSRGNPSFQFTKAPERPHWIGRLQKGATYKHHESWEAVRYSDRQEARWLAWRSGSTGFRVTPDQRFSWAVGWSSGDHTLNLGNAWFSIWATKIPQPIPGR